MPRALPRRSLKARRKASFITEGRFFFFEKKKQKTFANLRTWPTANWWDGATHPIDKSLFASFSSEKEESLLR
jgi:hypothetical protein